MPLDSTTVAGQIGGKDFWDEDVEEHLLSGGNSTATRTITCRWDDRFAIAIALSGGTTQTGIIQTNVPASKYPDAPQLEVQGIHPVGVGKRKVGVNGMVGYDFARVRIDYGLTKTDIGQTQDLGYLSLDISSEIYSPPRDEPTFKWVSDGVDVTPEATPALSIATADFERARRNLAEIPMPLILRLLDHVNDAPLLGAATGTLIFKGARPSRKVTNLGFQNWDIGYFLKWRRVPWNQFLRPSTGDFEEVVYKANGDPFYPDGNLAALFQ